MMSAVKKEESFMTSEEMLERSSSWTLACDNALLNRLKKFSEDLTKTSQDILKECDTLSSSVTQLDYRLINVSNEFLMLSNTQFVENRVEEFEEFSSSISSNTVRNSIPKTKPEKEAALLSKMRQAIQLGLSACNEKRQRNESQVNRFTTKQPYLIGSPKFFSSKYCGLVDESRRQVPIYNDHTDVESVSSEHSRDTHVPVMNTKPEVTFTMPPTPVFPNKVLHTSSENIKTENHAENGKKINHGRHGVPPSPTISDRSSDVGGTSISSISRDNAMPRSVTDELNKIYGSFVPPPAPDDDSDDDFRPSAGVGRIFEDEDDDIFGEKELFPSNQKKTDFFGSSNPSQLPAPVFSVPPPTNPASQPKAAVNDVQTLVGPQPKANDFPNMNRATGDVPSSGPKNDALIRGPPPEAEGPSRIKLPPGAVSMFGGLAPPVFNNGNLQAAPTTNKNVPSLATKADKQISSNSAVEVGSGHSSVLKQDSVVVSSHEREDVNQQHVTSQPSHNITVPGRTENISQGSSSGSGDASSKGKKTQVVPVSSLFAEDSSDEDIFLSSKKQPIINFTKPNQPKENPITNAAVPSTSGARNATSKLVDKLRVKKSIFDDSESEDDLFSSRPSFYRPANSNPVTVKSAKDDTFKPVTKKDPAPVKVNKTKSLFGDDSDSDTDLFGNKKKATIKSSALPSKTIVPPKMEDVKADNVWDDDDLFKAPAQPKPREKTPVISNENNNNNENLQEANSNEISVIQSSSSDTTISKANANAQEDPKPAEKKPGIKKSIFDDSESDDDLFSSKSSSRVDPNKGESVPPIIDQIRPLSTSTTTKGKRSSLFGDDSDSDSDLFSSKAKKTGIEKSASFNKENVVEDKSNSKVIDIEGESTADHGENQKPSDEVDTLAAAVSSSKAVEEIATTCDENKSEDEPKSAKVLGSKISAKIKAMQTAKPESNDVDADPPIKKNIKSKVSVKSLALNLNINPLALKVGAKPPKVSGSTPSTPDRDLSDVTPVNDASPNAASMPNSPEVLSSEEVVKNKNIEISKDKDDSDSEKFNEEPQKLTSNDQTVRVDDLVGILKARVKIQRKRRPPSRSFLKSFVVQEEDVRDNQKESEEKKAEDNEEDEKETESQSEGKIENEDDKDTETE